MKHFWVGRMDAMANASPALYYLFAWLVAACYAPALEQIKLTTRFDIEIIRSPVYGFPSSFNHTLMIGLPVMSCMSATHFFGNSLKLIQQQMDNIRYLKNEAI